VSRAPVRAPRGGRGFSLLEVVIASGLLLLTVIVVTGAVTSISRAGRRAEAAARADRVLESVLARLDGLPFCAACLPTATRQTGPEATDFVAAVFPEADTSHGSAGARYFASDEDGASGGSFLTRYVQDGVEVTYVARFRRPGGGALLGPADLYGWDLAASSRLPSPVVSVDVVAAVSGAVRSGRLVREAGADAVPELAPAPSVVP
jgi:hypothetical protein